MRIGDYEIERDLADDDSGVLYLGTHVVLPRQAAIKVAHAATKNIAVQMLREACLLEALAHPGIPRVYECGVLSDRRPWTAREFIEGETLAALTLGGPLPLSDVVLLVRDVADVLVHAHGRGVVHRRLTADAIFRTPDRLHGVCVRHWGDARTLDAEYVRLDARDDVYALGVLAYRALTGKLPDSAISVGEHCAGAPVELTSLVDTMLASQPGSRPTSLEVRDRVRWLVDTTVAIPRRLPTDDGFAIRIGRKSH